jgi:hypothetical protein
VKLEDYFDHYNQECFTETNYDLYFLPLTLNTFLADPVDESEPGYYVEVLKHNELKIIAKKSFLNIYKYFGVKLKIPI